MGFSSQKRVALPYRLSTWKSPTQTVLNVLGQQVATLVDGETAAGQQAVQFDAARELASGVYYYTVIWAGQHETRQMVLMK